MSVLSGIAVSALPENLEEVTRSINALDWAEVHLAENDGRMVVVIEAPGSEEGMNRLLEVKALPHVVAAEMVQHWFENEVQEPADPTSGIPIARLEGPVEELRRNRRSRKSTPKPSEKI